MKQQTYMHIPTPCHEDWEKMTPNQQGRFCDSCAKTVVDFNVMTDQQILNYFSNVQGNVCGRFSSEQLNRPLQEITTKKKPLQWLVASIASLFFVNRGIAQGATIKKQSLRDSISGSVNATKKSSFENVVKALDALVINKQLPKIVNGRYSFKGKIVDEEKKPIPFATVTVTINETKASVTADSLGCYSVSIANEKGHLPKIEITSIGYHAVIVDGEKLSNTNEIVLQTKTNEIDEVIVSTLYHTAKCSLRAGGTSLIQTKTITVWDTAQQSARKVLGMETFKTYPNPINQGSNVNLLIKKTGNYTVQIVSNNGQAVQVQQLSIDQPNATKQLTIPATLSKGVYYIRLIDEATKKQYVEKLIVQ